MAVTPVTKNRNPLLREGAECSAWFFFVAADWGVVATGLVIASGKLAPLDGERLRSKQLLHPGRIGIDKLPGSYQPAEIEQALTGRRRSDAFFRLISRNGRVHSIQEALDELFNRHDLLRLR